LKAVLVFQSNWAVNTKVEEHRTNNSSSLDHSTLQAGLSFIAQAFFKSESLPVNEYESILRSVTTLSQPAIDILVRCHETAKSLNSNQAAILNQVFLKSIQI